MRLTAIHSDRKRWSMFLRRNWSASIVGPVQPSFRLLSRFAVLRWFLAALILTMASQWLGAASVKLGIAALDSQTRAVADRLTIDLSAVNEIELLERSEIDRVLAEQHLSLAAGSDVVRLGALLSANGLLILERRETGAGPLLAAKLVAAGPGVVLLDDVAPWPPADSSEWCQRMVRLLEPMLPKLAVSKENAIPISILNLRSALQSREARETERELTLLLIHRLAQEPRVFVLERRHLAEALFEKQIAPDETEPIWTGRYLIDGTLDGEGFDPAKVTVRLRLTMPEGAGSTIMEISGPRTNLVEVAEGAVRRLLTSLEVAAGFQDWSATDEAIGFVDEARWALKWKLWKEAQAASESAWALGLKSRACTELRIRSRLGEAVVDSEPHFLNLAPPPNPADLPALLGAAEIYRDHASFAPTNGARYDLPWFDLGMDVLGKSTALLLQFHDVVESRPDHETALAELRAAVRKVAELVQRNGPSNRGLRGVATYPEERWYSDTSFGDLCWEGAGLWDDKPVETVVRLGRLLEAGYTPADRPAVRAWSWEDRKRVPDVYREWIDDLTSSPDPRTRMEGKFLAMAWTPFDEAGSLQRKEEALVSELWDQRQALLTSRPGILWRTEKVLRAKRNLRLGAYTFEPWKNFQHRLRLEYLRTNKEFDQSNHSLDAAVFGKLFSTPSNAEVLNWTGDEARELMPLLKALRDRQGSRFAYKWHMDIALDCLAAAAMETSAPPVSKPTPVIAPAPGTPSILKASFLEWEVPVQRNDPGMGRLPVEYVLFRQGSVWAHVVSRPDPFNPSDIRTLFVKADPVSGRTTSIPFPVERGKPDPMWVLGGGPFFEVDRSAIWISVQDHLARYTFSDGAWTDVKIPMDKGAVLSEIDDRLYLLTRDSLLRLTDRNGSVQVLASARRRPPTSPLDSIVTQTLRVFTWSPETFGVGAANQLVTISPEGSIITDTTMIAGGRDHRLVRPWPTRDAFLFGVSGSGYRKRLLGVWQGSTNVQNLLEQSWNEYAMKQEGAVDAALPPARWAWPTNYALRSAVPTTDGESLWLLHPSMGSLDNFRGDSQPDSVSEPADGRSATLLVFSPGAKTAVEIPLELLRHDKPMDLFREREKPDTSGYAPPFLLDAEDALILVNPGLPGHWRIPKSEIRKHAAAHRVGTTAPSFKGVAP